MGFKGLFSLFFTFCRKKPLIFCISCTKSLYYDPPGVIFSIFSVRSICAAAPKANPSAPKSAANRRKGRPFRAIFIHLTFSAFFHKTR